MRRKTALLALILAAGWTTARAQATGTPSYNAPYRAFARSEVGLVVAFPNAGTAFEGVYRMAKRRFDLGFRAGIFDRQAGDALFLLGAEGRQRVITHSTDFPLDGALLVGLGAQLASNNSVLLLPVGLSLGRRIDVEGSKVSIVPYIQPTATIVFGDNSDVFFALGLGADFRLTPRFDARVSAGIGDLEGISVAAIWVH